jgi:hypothetical protein
VNVKKSRNRVGKKSVGFFISPNNRCNDMFGHLIPGLVNIVDRSTCRFVLGGVRHHAACVKVSVNCLLTLGYPIMK